MPSSPHSLQSVSHDLRTPLATILTATATLRRSRDEPARTESAQAIEREVEYLNRLVTNLLDLSRIEAGVLRAQTDVFELDDLLAGSLERLEPSLAGRSLDVNLPPLPIRVDPIFLDAAFSNVIDNAVRHAPFGSPIRISARPTDDDHGHADRRGWRRRRPRHGPSASVREVLPGIGRTIGVTHGTGIGLAVVQGLVEAMGGTVGGAPQRARRAGNRHRRCRRATVPAELVSSTP